MMGPECIRWSGTAHTSTFQSDRIMRFVFRHNRDDAGFSAANRHTPTSMADKSPTPPRPSIWNRLLAPYHEFGGYVGTLYLCDRILQAMCPSVRVFSHAFVVQPVNANPLLPESRLSNYAFREILPGDPDIAYMPIPATAVAKRYEQGAWCLGTYLKGQFVGYIWFCTDVFEEDVVRTRYRLPPGAVFDFDLYIVPERRLGTTFAAIWHGANQFLSERSIRYSFSRVTRFNSATQRAHARLGARTIGTAIFLRIFQVELMISSMRPFLFLSWDQGMPPTVKFL